MWWLITVFRTENWCFDLSLCYYFGQTEIGYGHGLFHVVSAEIPGMFERVPSILGAVLCRSQIISSDNPMHFSDIGPQKDRKQAPIILLVFWFFLGLAMHLSTFSSTFRPPKTVIHQVLPSPALLVNLRSEVTATGPWRPREFLNIF